MSGLVFGHKEQSCSAWKIYVAKQSAEGGEGQSSSTTDVRSVKRHGTMQGNLKEVEVMRNKMEENIGTSMLGDVAADTNQDIATPKQAVKNTNVADSKNYGLVTPIKANISKGNSGKAIKSSKMEKSSPLEVVGNIVENLIYGLREGSQGSSPEITPKNIQCRSPAPWETVQGKKGRRNTIASDREGYGKEVVEKNTYAALAGIDEDAKTQTESEEETESERSDEEPMELEANRKLLMKEIVKGVKRIEAESGGKVTKEQALKMITKAMENTIQDSNCKETETNGIVQASNKEDVESK